MKPFLERFLGLQARDPQKISGVAELLSSFVVNFPDDAQLQRLVSEQTIAEADEVRLRFTMSVANQTMAVVAMKAAIQADLSPLLKQKLHEQVAQLSTRVRIGDYVRDAAELTTLGAALELQAGAPPAKTREANVMAWELFESLGRIRESEYSTALRQDAANIPKKGFPAFSKKVAVHYVGESQIDVHTEELVNKLAARLNEIYRVGFSALVREIQVNW